MAAPENTIAALNQRIVLAEHRLLARQQDIRQRWQMLGQVTRQATRPPRLLTAFIGAGLVGFLARWLRGGATHGSAIHSALPAAVAAGHGRGGGLPWSELLLIAWPFLPSRWRAKVSPATITGLIALGLPLIDHLRGKTTHPAPPTPVASMDLARFGGTWFEIARLPSSSQAACGGQPSATYTPCDDGGSEFEVLRRCPARKGGMRSVRGVGHLLPESGGAKFKISLLPSWLRWLPLAWSEQWILYLDPDYTVAWVGDPGRRFLWLLARERQLPDAQLRALVSLARVKGYPVDLLEVVTPASS